MISPGEDKAAIRAIIGSDPYIKRAGFLPERISTTGRGGTTLDPETDDFRIFISSGVPENPFNKIQMGVVYKVKVSGNRDRSAVVDSVTQQIVALLSESEIGNGGAHILHLLDPPMELESDPSLYITETAFICYETIYTKIKN